LKTFLAITNIVLLLLLGSVTHFYEEQLTTLNEIRTLDRVEFNAKLDEKQGQFNAVSQLLDVVTNSRPLVFSAYNALPNQTDDTPNITASNKQIYPGVLALSREMLTPYGFGGDIAYGDKVIVMIEMTVEDTMHERWRQRGDVFMINYAAAMNFGRKEGRIYHVGNSDPYHVDG